MAMHHAAPGEVVDLASWADDLPGEKTKAIVKTDTLELARLGKGPVTVRRGNYTFEGAQAATRALLSDASRPDAIFCASDYMAFAAIDVARREFNLDVGVDLSIVGVDDVAEAGQAYDLTTFSQPPGALAGEAIALIDLHMADPEAAAEKREVSGDLIVQTGRIVARDLRMRFGIATPRLGISGLNPHAGEGGTIGLEELDIIGPAVATLQHEGIEADGPIPADTLFYPPHWRRYDAVIAMYHDQALIPIKTIAFDEAVNVTLGLPIVRTSPDHGTAFDLAGTGRGSTASLLAALRMADEMTAPHA